MNKFLTLTALGLISTATYANPGLSAQNAAVLETTTPTKGVSCRIDAIDNNQREIKVFEKFAPLKEEGATLESAVGPSYSVLIQHYLAKSEGDSTPNERFEIAINSKKQQEDYINSSAKPVVFLSALEGTLSTGEAFVGISIDCRPAVMDLPREN